MTFVSLASALRRPLQRFAVEQDGVSAIEFALLLPLMLTLYLGGVEVSQAVSADRKTMLAAHTIGDLTSQAAQCISGTADMPTIFGIANEVIYPFSPGNLQATVTGVYIDTNGKATVQWSYPSGIGRSPGTDVSTLLPAALRPTGSGVSESYLIWAEASYNYKPTIGYVITGTLKLKEQIYLRPRQPNSNSGLTGGLTYQATGACS